MSTLAEALAPRSDQLNADDLIHGPRTIKITAARIVKDGRDTKIVINFEGDNGKPWKPCKTMGRAMVLAWAITDESQLVGKSVRLYRDASVKFGDQGEVGGIRISHMSDIQKPVNLKLTVSQGKKGMFTFHPLLVEQKADKVADGVATLIERIKACHPADLLSITDDPAVVKQRAWLTKNRPELAAEVDAVLDASPTVNEDDPFGLPALDQEKRGDDEMGESHTDPDPQHRKLADIMITGIRKANGDVDAIGEIMDAQRDAMKEWPTALKQEVYDEQNIALGRGDA